MKKTIILSAMVLTMCTQGYLATFAQSQSTLGYKLNHKLKVYNMHKANAAKGLNAAPAADKITVIGTLKEGIACPTEELNALGVKVMDQCFGMVIMEVSMDQLEALGRVSAFSVINANKKNKVKNKQSHVTDRVADVQDPDNLPDGLKQIYTGKGVLVGVIDTGFDFTHRNFKDAEGHSRIKHVWRSSGEGEQCEEYSTAEEIDTLTTDSYTGSHATHTTGTAAGSYSGSYSYKDGTTISGEQGAAYESELLLASGLDDATIMRSLDGMITYAKEHGKPIAINMSFGNNDAWMDGKNVNTTLLKNASDGGNAPGVLMCVSAGNEGDSNRTFCKTLNAGEKISTELSFNEEPEDNYDINIVSDDATPFNVRLIGYDEDGNIIKTYSLNQDEDTICSSLSYTRGFAQEHDGRFYVEITGDKECNMDDNISDYVLEISATEACQVRFCSAEVTCSNRLNGKEMSSLYFPENNNCLNDMIQNKYGFAVGAYASALTVKKYDCTEQTSDSPAVGAITPFSSWVSVPYKNNVDSIGIDFVAPGSMILSSINHYDIYFSDFLAAKADDNTLLGYMEGTSMSAPNATGIMALWLQACPTLTTTEVREIIKKTADKDEFTTGANARRAGYGKINCLAGLQEVLENYATGIFTVNAEKTSVCPAQKKVLRNGQLIIIKDGMRYNILGQQD